MSSDKAYDVERRFNNLITRLGPAGDTSWTDTSSMANGWGKGSGYFRYKLMPGGLFVALSAKLLTPGTVADGTQIVTTALAAAYRPASNQRTAAWCDNLKAGTVSGPAESAGVELRSDGTIVCYGIQTSATRLDVNALVPLDI